MKEILEEIIDIVKGDVANQETLERVKYLIKDLLSQRVKQSDRQYLEFDAFLSVYNPGEITIQPKNLFSLLIFKGVDVTYDEVKDKDEYKTCVGTFIFKDGVCGFIPAKPAEYIIVDTKGETK